MSRGRHARTTGRHATPAHRHARPPRSRRRPVLPGIFLPAAAIAAAAAFAAHQQPPQGPSPVRPQPPAAPLAHAAPGVTLPSHASRDEWRPPLHLAAVAPSASPAAPSPSARPTPARPSPPPRPVTPSPRPPSPPPPPPPSAAPASAAPTVDSPASAQAWARQRVPSSQWSCLLDLWNHESGWDATAVNASSGAYGIPQINQPGTAGLPPHGWSGAVAQMQWGLDYIANRYGTPCGAWQHELGVGWY